MFRMIIKRNPQILISLRRGLHDKKLHGEGPYISVIRTEYIGTESPKKCDNYNKKMHEYTPEELRNKINSKEEYDDENYGYADRED